MKHSIEKNLFRKIGAISIFALFVCTNANAEVCSTDCPDNCRRSDCWQNNCCTAEALARYDSIVAQGRAIERSEQNRAAQAAAALRAQGDGCDNEDNDRIIAELALCSTHAYNIGAVQNPSDAAEKQLIKDAVALKTTVMTQQMNKQYEYLESMMKRFKTQLEKAVLTTKIQAAAGGASGNGASGTGGGAGSSSGGNGGGESTAKRETNVFIEGAQNCAYVLDVNKKLDCLESNFAEINAAANTKLTSDVRKQLAADFGILMKANILANDGRYKLDNPNNNCEKGTNSNTTAFRNCLNAHANNISNAKRQLSLEDQQSRYPGSNR